MEIEERILFIEDKLNNLSQIKKDFWDKFSLISSAFIPIAIAFVGTAYSITSKRAETQVADIQAVAESKLKQAELISKFFEPLTGDDDKRRKLAIESLLVAAPDYGPIVVRVLSQSENPLSVSTAGNALNERRDLLIRQLFDSDADIRKDAYRQLVASWANDELLIPALIEYGMNNQSNLNGVYNALALLSNMQSETIVKQKKTVEAFANAVEKNGSKTKERADILRSRLKN